MCLNIFTYFEINSFIVKNFNMRLLSPYIWNTVQNDLIKFCLTNLSLYFTTGNTDKYLLWSIIRSVYSINFILCSFLIMKYIARFCLENEFTGEKYSHKTKTNEFKCSIVLLTTWTKNISDWHISSPHNRVCRYWGFSLDTSVPGASSAILKYRTNNNNCLCQTRSF